MAMPTQTRRNWIGWYLILPLVLVLVPFFVAPIIGVVIASFVQSDGFGGIAKRQCEFSEIGRRDSFTLRIAVDLIDVTASAKCGMSQRAIPYADKNQHEFLEADPLLKLTLKLSVQYQSLTKNRAGLTQSASIAQGLAEIRQANLLVTFIAVLQVNSDGALV